MKVKTVFKTLRDEETLERFITQTEKHIQIRFPLSYLKKSKVVALMSLDGEILGGYVLVLKGPFRVIESLPSFVSQCHKWISNKHLGETCEITGLWLSPKIVKQSVKMRFWLNIYLDILSVRKKYFVYAYSLNKPSLGKIYSIGKPTVLYQGETKILEGMKEPDCESVEMIPVRNLIWVPISRPDLFLKRLMAPRGLYKNRKYRRDVRKFEREIQT